MIKSAEQPALEAATYRPKQETDLDTGLAADESKGYADSAAKFNLRVVSAKLPIRKNNKEAT